MNLIRVPVAPSSVLACGRREAPFGIELMRSLLGDAEVTPDVDLSMPPPVSGVTGGQYGRIRSSQEASREVGSVVEEQRPDEAQGRYPVDWFLETLVRIVNGSGSSFGITISVRGLVISGELVGGQEFFGATGEQFESLVSDESTKEAVRLLFQHPREVYESNEENPEPLHHLHLRNAHFYGTDGTRLPTDQGTWWRGRLDSVDGWALGSFAPGRA